MNKLSTLYYYINYYVNQLNGRQSIEIVRLFIISTYNTLSQLLKHYPMALLNNLQ